MASHSKDQREFIVLRLAGFESPADIAVALMARWTDTACSLADVEALDPKRGAMLSPELFAAFTTERARVIADPNSAPTTNQQVRLIELHRMFEKARDRNALGAAAEFLAQIATELGIGGKAGKGSGVATNDVPEVKEIIVKRIVVQSTESPPDTAS